MARERTVHTLVAALAVSLAACGGTIAFKDNIAVKVPAPQQAQEPKQGLVEVTVDRIEIKEKVLFEIDKAEIRPESFGLLDEVAGVMTQTPRIKRVKVIGHTDNDGEEAYNQQLSERRAASVREYLVDHGVEEVRLESEGRGESDPIVSNDTFEGREKNRRVEFLITEQDDTKKVTVAEAAKLADRGAK